MSVNFIFYLIRCNVDFMWQGVSETLFRKFVLYSDCVYVVSSTCVNIVNDVVLMKR